MEGKIVLERVGERVGSKFHWMEISIHLTFSRLMASLIDRELNGPFPYHLV